MVQPKLLAIISNYSLSLTSVPPLCTTEVGKSIPFSMEVSNSTSDISANLCIDDKVKISTHADPRQKSKGVPSAATVRSLIESTAASYCDNFDEWKCNNCLDSSSLSNAIPISDKETDTRGVIGVNHKTNSIVVAFPGSLSTKNWDTNFDMAEAEVEIEGQEPIKLHNGYYSSSKAIYDFIETHVSKLQQKVPSYKLQFTGHSLGGALALITAFLFIKNGACSKKQIEVVTFGMPQIANEGFDNYMKKQGVPITNVINQDDWVPKAPPTSPYKSVSNIISYTNVSSSSCMLKPNGEKVCNPDSINEYIRKKNIFPEFVVPWDPLHFSYDGFTFDPFCSCAETILNNEDTN